MNFEPLDMSGFILLFLLRLAMGVCGVLALCSLPGIYRDVKAALWRFNSKRQWEAHIKRRQVEVDRILEERDRRGDSIH